MTTPSLRVRPMLGWQRPVRTRSGQEGSGGGGQRAGRKLSRWRETHAPLRGPLLQGPLVPATPANTPNPSQLLCGAPCCPAEPQAPGSKAPIFPLALQHLWGRLSPGWGPHGPACCPPGPGLTSTCSSPWRATAASSDSPTQPYSRGVKTVVGTWRAGPCQAGPWGPRAKTPQGQRECPVTHTCLHTCTRSHTHVRLHTHAHTLIHAHTRSRTHVHMHAHMLTCTCSHTRARSHTRTHTHSHARSHTRTCPQNELRPCAGWAWLWRAEALTLL